MGTLHYQQKSRDRFEQNLQDPLHHFLLPLLVLLAGALAGVSWYVRQLIYGKAVGFLGMILLLALVVTKSAILTTWAQLASRQTGFAFARTRVQLLRITAAVVFIDALRLWLHVAMKYAGMLSESGKGPGRAQLLDVAVMLFFSLFLGYFAFGLDSEDAKAFGGLVGIGNWIIDLLCRLAIVLLLKTFLA